MKLVLFFIGTAFLVILVGWFGTRSIGSDVLRAGWAIPLNIIIHLTQLFVAASAWYLLIGSRTISVHKFFIFRMIREGVNSLLPVAHIGGPIVGIRLISKAGIPTNVAASGTTLDITVETIAQLLFTMAGIVVLSMLVEDSGWFSWAGGGLAMGTLGIIGFIIAQRSGLLHLVEWLADLCKRFFPKISIEGLAGLHDELMRLQQNRRALLQSLGLHLLAWIGGMIEVFIALKAIGYPVGLPQAFVIESLAMAARSAGFAIPGALGIQEGGFLFVGSLFGVPPDAAIALSMVKRLREVCVAVPSLMIWQWSEIRRYFSSYFLD